MMLVHSELITLIIVYIINALLLSLKIIIINIIIIFIMGECILLRM
jgi:hypothetical protein